MRIASSLTAAALSLCSALAAQTTAEGLEILPGRATGANNGITYVTRVSGTPFPSFEALMGYDDRFWQGIGDLTNTTRAKVANKPDKCEIDTVRIAYQDENGATQEGFNIFARKAQARTGTAIPLPDLSASGILLQQAVPGSPPTANGGVAFRYQIQFMQGPNATAIANPCDGTFYFAMELPLVPNGATWPTTDGLGMPASTYDTVTGYTRFDWPKGGNAASPLYYLNITSGAGGSGRFATNMSFTYNLIPDAPVLQAGARHKMGTSRHGSDNGWGTSGVWPEVDSTTARGQLSTDGLVIRFTDNHMPTASSGTWFLIASVGSARGPNGLGIPLLAMGGIGGRIYTHPVFVGPIAGALSNQTDTEVILFPDGSLPTSLIGSTIYLQGATNVTGFGAHLTNLVGIQYK